MKVDMETGKRYRVVYRSGQQRRDHYFVMDYLDDGDGMDAGYYFFSARPVAGTCRVRKSWVKEITEVGGNDKIIVDRIVRNV